MKGQCIGAYTGSDGGGQVTVDVDDLGDRFEVTGVIRPADSNRPTVIVQFRTADHARKCACVCEYIQPVNPRTDAVCRSPEEKAEIFGDWEFPSSAEVEIQWNETELSFKWKSKTGDGACTLRRELAATQSSCNAEEVSWDCFKSKVARLERNRYMFRGQRKTWRLRTSFHRSGRANLYRYLEEDLPVVHRHLSARTRHLFDRSRPEENGAFLNLLQHHGYPTPLIDWTHSPYVAAFFAYHKVMKTHLQEPDNKDKVRIYMFDQRQWKRDLTQIQNLTTTFPHFSILEFLAVDNDRLIPQQGLCSVTNVDDVESYIHSKESTERRYLQAFDLPAIERSDVMSELCYMGITAGSLFPGLDGACEELRDRFF